MKSEDRKIEEKLRQVLHENTTWSGSPEAMWDQISAKLPKTTPWWGRQRILLITTAAAMILIAVLLPNLPWSVPRPLWTNDPPDLAPFADSTKTEIHPTQPTEPLQSPVAPRMQTMDAPQPISLFMAPFNLGSLEMVPGESYEITVELMPTPSENVTGTAHYFEASQPFIRIIRLSDDNEPETIMEKAVAAWTELGVTADTLNDISSATIAIEAPAEPGTYILEVTGETQVESEEQIEKVTLTGQTSFIVK